MPPTPPQKSPSVSDDADESEDEGLSPYERWVNSNRLIVKNKLAEIMEWVCLHV